MKEISQNSDRYKVIGTGWNISASSDIKPLYLPKGIGLTNLKPLIQANGIIVKVGEDYLCSLYTLNEIRDSNNPHYDIVENGTITVGSGSVSIGKTVKIIELDISRLESIGNLQDIKGIKAGVESVEYIYEGEKTDGIPNNLITQINYTLTEDSKRGLDTYSLYGLKLAPQEAYSMDALKVVEQNGNELLDNAKLKVFTDGVRERVKLLREDFHMIKRMFFEGITPINNDGPVTISNTIPDPLTQLLGAKDYHTVIYKEVGEVQRYRDIQGVQRALVNQVGSQQNELIKATNTITQQIQQGQLADAQTQQAIQQQLEVAKTQLAALQKKVNG